MKRLVMTSRIGSDGVLHLTLPLWLAEADQEMRVTVESVSRPQLTQEEWQRQVLATAGKWQGDFERPDQGELEEREPLA